MLAKATDSPKMWSALVLMVGSCNVEKLRSIEQLKVIFVQEHTRSTKISHNEPEMKLKIGLATKEAFRIQLENMIESRAKDPTYQIRRQIAMTKSRLKRGYHAGATRGVSWKRHNTVEQIDTMIAKIIRLNGELSLINNNQTNLYNP